MKTTYFTLSEETIKTIKANISTTEKRTAERSFVLNQIRKDLKTDLPAEVVSALEKNWKRFVELQAFRMPHVIYNGQKTPTIVDWVEDKGNFKLDKAIKSYRFGNEDAIHVDGCTDGRVERIVETKKTEMITFESGWTMEVPSRDAEGNTISETTTKVYVPKAKTAWGYTQTMVDATVDAIDDLMEELAK